MGKKKTPSYLTVNPDVVGRLRSLGYATIGTSVPSNRKARRAYAASANGILPPAVVLPVKKDN